MQYQFSVGAFFIGIIIVIVGAIWVRYYQWVADNFGSGVASYDRYRLYAILSVIFGLLTTVNLPIFLLGLIFNSVFNR